MKVLKIWTDGSCMQSTNSGGLGVVFVYQDKIVHEYNQKFDDVTNNQMEIMAIACALFMIDRPVDRIEIYTDSQYCLGILNSGWNMNTNHQWWKKVEEAKKQAHKWCQSIKFLYTRGHSTDPYNNRADALATIASGYKKAPSDFKLVTYRDPVLGHFKNTEPVDVTISQSLSRTIRMNLPNLPADLSEVNWHEIYFGEHHSPLDLIHILKQKCDEAIEVLEKVTDADVSGHIDQLKHISQECIGWHEDDREIISDNVYDIRENLQTAAH